MVTQFIYENLWNANNYLFYFLTKSPIVYINYVFITKEMSDFPSSSLPGPALPGMLPEVPTHPRRLPTRHHP